MSSLRNLNKHRASMRSSFESSFNKRNKQRQKKSRSYPSNNDSINNKQNDNCQKMAFGELIHSENILIHYAMNIKNKSIKITFDIENRLTNDDIFDVNLLIYPNKQYESYKPILVRLSSILKPTYFNRHSVQVNIEKKGFVQRNDILKFSINYETLDEMFEENPLFVFVPKTKKLKPRSYSMELLKSSETININNNKCAAYSNEHKQNDINPITWGFVKSELSEIVCSLKSMEEKISFATKLTELSKGIKDNMYNNHSDLWQDFILQNIYELACQSDCLSDKIHAANVSDTLAKEIMSRIKKHKKRKSKKRKLSKISHSSRLKSV